MAIICVCMYIRSENITYHFIKYIFYSNNFIQQLIDKHIMWDSAIINVISILNINVLSLKISPFLQRFKETK